MSQAPTNLRVRRRVRKCETCWRVQTFKIDKMAAIDISINGSVSLVNTSRESRSMVPREHFSSDLWCSDNRPVSHMYLMRGGGGGAEGAGGGGGGGAGSGNTKTKYGKMRWPHSYFRQRSFVITADKVAEISVISLWMQAS